MIDHRVRRAGQWCAEPCRRSAGSRSAGSRTSRGRLAAGEAVGQAAPDRRFPHRDDRVFALVTIARTAARRSRRGSSAAARCPARCMAGSSIWRAARLKPRTRVPRPRSRPRWSMAGCLSRLGRSAPPAGGSRSPGLRVRCRGRSPDGTDFEVDPVARRQTRGGSSARIATRRTGSSPTCGRGRRSRAAPSRR